MNQFYDEGWNAYIDGVPYDRSATLDWRDGWKDAQYCETLEGNKPVRYE